MPLFEPMSNGHQKCVMTMMTLALTSPRRAGIVELDHRGVVVGFHEKVESPPGNLANGAVYIISAELLEMLGKDLHAVTDFSTEVLHRFVRRIYSHETSEVFLDVGTPESYESELFSRIKSMTGFIARQIDQIRQGGGAELWRRIKLAKPILLGLPLYVLATPAVVVIRLMKPWLIVRLGSLTSTSIGHFAANTELYFCERDAGINMPMQRSIDFFYLRKPICNKQLTIMWKRVLRIWPAWFLGLVDGANRLIPGGAVHEIGNNTQNDRDVHNLLDQFAPHLQFTIEEEARGESGAASYGNTKRDPFHLFDGQG